MQFKTKYYYPDTDSKYKSCIELKPDVFLVGIMEAEAYLLSDSKGSGEHTLKAKGTNIYGEFPVKVLVFGSTNQMRKIRPDLIDNLLGAYKVPKRWEDIPARWVYPVFSVTHGRQLEAHATDQPNFPRKNWTPADYLNTAFQAIGDPEYFVIVEAKEVQNEGDN